MTTPPPVIARPVAVPRPIPFVRGLAIVQLVLGIGTSLFLGFCALLGLAYPYDDGSGPGPLAFGVLAAFVVAVLVTITMFVLAMRLRPGAAGTRISLLVVDTVLVAALLSLMALSGSLGSLEGLVAWPGFYAASGVATIVLLLQPSVRRWCRVDVAVTA